MQNHENQIIIADTRFLITESLEKILLDEFRIKSCVLVRNKAELLYALASHPVSLLIIDYNHIDFEGIPEIKKLVLQTYEVAILALVESVKKNELIELNAIGIKNILLKNADREELVAGIKSALSGKKYYCQEVLDLFSEIHLHKPVLRDQVNLTISEIEIIKAIAEGATTKQIAAKKFISYHTVMTHRKNIFRKLAINNVSELVMFAIRSGIVEAIDYQI